MWKYRCRMQLIALLLSFVAGFFLVLLALNTGSASTTMEILPDDVISIVNENQIMTCIMGGFVIAGIANVILISQMLMIQYNLSPFLLYILLFIMPTYVILTGTILVVPMVLLSIYGMWSLHSNQTLAFKRANLSGDQELVRVYEIHHKLDPQYKAMAEECRRNVSRAAGLYLLGIAAVLCVIFLINNIWVIMLVLLFYMLAFNLIARYRTQALLPITSLLYEKCDPEACISAIIYYSTRKGKIRLTNQALMAQCLIYLNDPELAQDVLITYPRKDAASVLTYWSLMAYIYYLLKDEHGLQRCYEEASRVRLHYGQTGVMIRSEELSAIKNKIELMQGEFNTCKKYFLESLKKANFPFQRADACYYIGLISFVQKDYSLASLYFEQAIQCGNKLYFTANARNYLDKISQMDLDSAA